MKASWRELAADVELVVACGDDRHRLVWSAGAVRLADHPDLAAERALVAFGGPEPACLAHLRLWNDAVVDGGFLAEWVDEAHLDDARLSWLGTALDRMRLEGFHEFLRHLPPARAERMGHFVHRFPRAWLDRAACQVAEAVTGGDPGGRRVACAQAPSLVEQAVANRLRRAFVSSVGEQGLLSWGAAALVPLRIRPASTTGSVGAAAPAIAGQLTGPGRGVEVSVAPTWLYSVWGAGASVIDGHLVLSLDLTRDEARADGQIDDGPIQATCVVATTPGSEDSPGSVVSLATRGAVLRDGRWRLTDSWPDGRC